MKSLLPLCCVLFLFPRFGHSQTYAPISTTGYTLDAVAENTTALVNTSGVLDGSNYVLYSAAYGVLYSIVGGLPNNGLITAGGYTYQLQPYTQDNILFLPFGTTDTLVFTTPSPYASISLLAFATEGNATMNLTLRFTDNSTQVFSNVSLLDWFNGSSNIISGFGRANRSTGVITNPAGQPKMFNVDLNLTCANRLKNLAKIIVQNTSGNARVCIMAASGSGAPSYSSGSSSVSCAGGTDGTATISITNSLPPNTITWNTTPVQNAAVAVNLVAGTYNYTVVDAAGCSFTSSQTVGTSTTPLPPLSIGSSGTLVCPGTGVTLSSFGAVSYTWSNNQNSPVIVVNPTLQTVYSCTATTGANCVLTGSITVTTLSVTPVTFNPMPASFCVNSPSVALLVTPPGGIFLGSGLSSGSFVPALSGPGTFTISYAYTNANGCTSSQSQTTSVFALPIVTFSLSPSVFCLNSPSVNLNGTPSGGVYSGLGLSGTNFVPALAGAGSGSISYVYTDANNCSNSASVTYSVKALPFISITTSVSVICVKAASFNLQANPFGGQWSGTGVTGTAFSPSLAGLGTHAIVYTYTDAVTSCSDSRTHSITVSACTGLEAGFESDAGIMAFPNPATERLTIFSPENAQLDLIDLSGQIVKSTALGGGTEHQIDINSISAGAYTLRVRKDNGQIVSKILIVAPH